MSIRGRRRSLRRLLRGFMLCSISAGAMVPAIAQDSLHLHAQINGRAYQDDMIAVTAPLSWTIAVDDNTYSGLHSGAVLHKGKYVLRLCTGCGQTSGIVGGRFAEIAGLVQPWSRVEEPSGPCGKSKTTSVSKQFDRVDLWYRRDAAHGYQEIAANCRQPRTTATVWYGSYFAESCAGVPPGSDCGGYFLHFDWLTNPHSEDLSPFPEMAIGLTYETTDLDRLPRQGDPELDRVLAEASSIVRSVRFKKIEPQPAQ